MATPARPSAWSARNSALALAGRNHRPDLPTSGSASALGIASVPCAFLCASAFALGSPVPPSPSPPDSSSALGVLPVPGRSARESASGLTEPCPAELESISAGAERDRSEEHTSELQSLAYLVCRLLLEKKKNLRFCFIFQKKKNEISH